jgi:hypothetical protein
MDRKALSDVVEMNTTKFPFKVEAWTRDGQAIDRLIGAACNIVVARGAYQVAVDLYPGENITLRQYAPDHRRDKNRERKVLADTEGL